MTIGTLHAKPLLEIDSPPKATVLYFPSPAIARCLNHSGIPESLRKAKIIRSIKFSNKEELTQNIEVSVLDKIFILGGDLIDSEKENPYLSTDKKTNPGFLFGLGDLIGLQRKVIVKDKIGTEKLDYETFLKVTKGKIGKKKYYLELYGEDKAQNGKIKYFLKGNGKLGKDKINIEGKSTDKDRYEIKEKYGEIEVFTIVEVYD